MDIARDSESGFSLVLVMWGLALLSVIATALIGETRQATTISVARVAETQAGLLAEAGIERALVAIDEKASQRSWPEDGKPVAWDFAGGHLLIAIEDEAGKIDAFNAPDPMVLAALAHAGLDLEKQQKVAYEIRLAHAQTLFQDSEALQVATLDQLKEISSLTSEEIDRLRPIMTLRTGLAGFDPQIARRETIELMPEIDAGMIDDFLAARSRVVARGDAADRPASPAPAFTARSPRTIFSVHVEACTSDGHLAIRDAMIRREAPGNYVTLELRQPIEPVLMNERCAAPAKAPSRQS